ncbi:hypothetical protein N658DRAFT_500094, partial [Parathielavia hyrcaniae]
MADKMKDWAEANQVIIEPVYEPRFFLFKRDTTIEDTTIVWTRKRQTSLLVPLFKGTTEVSVRVRGSDAEYRTEWNCESVLHLDEDTGIRPLTGDLVFHYNLF